MAYTTNQIISGAYYASGVVSREFETVSGTEFGDALLWLNDIITEKVVDEGMIPFETTYNFNAVVGQEIYPIPGLIQIDTLVFFKNNVRFAMAYTKRNQYFGSNRLEAINTLPFQWYFEKQFAGGNLYIYFEPDQAYPMEIHGIFGLQTVVQGQDLSLTFDEWYLTYLRYALADRICAEYNFNTPPNVKNQLAKYEAWINKNSRVLDLAVSKASTLQNGVGLGWAYVNIGRGWLAP